MKNQVRPAIPRRSSSSRSKIHLSQAGLAHSEQNQVSTPSGGEEEPEVKHVNFHLDNRLPSDYFKQDIVKIIHELRIPKWKAVDFSSMAKDIVVSRISGALTNAVYCVQPPLYLKDLIKAAHTANVIGGIDQVTGAHVSSLKRTYHYKVPPKLLLRVYGPQAENLIDRDVELAVIARLSRRKIGPKMLGTFTNGRFEQFLEATALTKEDLRDPDVSIQIAKRMRELHDGLPLLDEERQKGPSVWKNIHSWAEPAKVRLLQLAKKEPGAVQRVLGVEDIETFFKAIEKYKAWVYEHENYTDESIKNDLVFAHNDAQYGNLLRVLPPPGSPLLRPKNEHRQIVVIDFEYSGANPRYFDIANHFCEWMSDYHNEAQPHFIHEDKYPTRSEQLNLIQGYVEHGATEFDDAKIQAEVDLLMQRVREWRPAVNAFWCIWGLVQAALDKTPEEEKAEALALSEQYKITTNAETGSSDEGEVEEQEDEEEAFDYFAYSAQKAQIFWGDLIDLGVIDAADFHGQIKHIAA